MGPYGQQHQYRGYDQGPAKKQIDHLGQGRDRSLIATSFEFTVQSFVIYRYRRMLPDVWAAHAKSRNGQIVSVEDRHFYRVGEQCFDGDAQQQTVRGGDTYFEVEPFPYCPPLIQGRRLVLSERKKVAEAGPLSGCTILQPK